MLVNEIECPSAEGKVSNETWLRKTNGVCVRDKSRFHKSYSGHSEYFFTMPHLSCSQGLSSSQYSCVVLKSNKKTKDQNPRVKQCQTFTTWNEVIYFFLLATQELTLFLSLTMTFKFALKKEIADILIPSYYFITKIMTALSLFPTAFPLPKEHYDIYMYPS